MDVIDVLAFGAHPDDVELGCGGTVIKMADLGYRTGAISLTHGELGTRGSAETRAKEFARSAEIMGLSVHKMLDIPDGDVAVTSENKVKVIREIREHRPRIVLAPYWAVRHPDHGHASNLVREATFFAGLKQIDTGQPAHRPNKILFYPGRFEFQPSFIVDTSAQQERKQAAILAYGSQFHSKDKHLYGEDETNISTPEFLEAMFNRDRQYGAYIGARYGEPFLVREPMRLDDPVAFFGPEYLTGLQ